METQLRNVITPLYEEIKQEIKNKETHGNRQLLVQICNLLSLQKLEDSIYSVKTCLQQLIELIVNHLREAYRNIKEGIQNLK